MAKCPSLNNLTVEVLNRFLIFDQETGYFFWRIAPSPRVKAGVLAGTLNSSGYRQIRIKKKQFLASRLAWLMAYGSFPNGEIDHIDRNKDNNRILNLRVVTRKQNMENTGKRKDNSSGYKGVSWEPRNQMWKSQIQHNKVKIHLGFHSSPEAASKAYLEASNRLFSHTPI
jgi:hypothetical protein